MTGLRYEWQRFWCPRDGSFSLADDGYLVDPTSEFGRTYNPDVMSFGELAPTPCLVLLGEPGMGKSDTLAREHSAAQERADRVTTLPPLWVDLRSYGSEDRLFRCLTGAPEIRRWADGDTILELFLDSLDECLLRVDTLAALLPEALARLPVDRLRLRVACRTADWPHTLGDGLMEPFGEERVGIYELTPLRRVDVAEAARANRLDPDTFLLEIAKREAQALANRPVTLEFLLRAKQQGGRLAGRRVDLYHDGCRLLSAETNQARLDAGYRGRMGADQRLRLAAHIAAATVFANRYAVWTGPESGPVPPEDVVFREIRAGTLRSAEPDDGALDEVLGTGLFSSRGSQRMGWSHQTYGEFLAARWAVEGGLDLDQILGLLTNPHDPEHRLVPQLHETAAWVASMRPDAFLALAERDPEALLRGDVMTADPEQRRALTQALLDGYDSERIVDTDWSLRPLYRKLAHPGLADQLRRFVADPEKGLMVRRAAINIAEACDVTELQEELISMALDRAEPAGVRKEAASAAAAVTDPMHRLKLRPLLDADGDEDPEDALRSYALEALWPDHLSADELFRYLSPPRRPSLYGQYKYFIRDYLPPTLTDRDLPAALEWVRHREPRHHVPADVLEELADEILVRVWRSKPRGSTLNTFAEIALLRSKDHVPLVGHDRQRELSELLSADPTARRGLVLAMLNGMTDKDGIWCLWTPGPSLIDSHDVPWLLDWLVRGEGSEQAKRFAAEVLVRFLFDRDDPDEVSAVLEAAGESEALRTSLAPLIDPLELDSARAATMRSEHEKYKALERRREQWELRLSKPLDPPPGKRVRAALERCEAGDPEGFWVLALELTLKPDSRHYNEEFEPDLTSLPGWLEADAETRGRIIRAAERYVRGRDPDPERWLGTNVWHRPAFAGYKALRLVLTADPEFVAGLSPAEWARWAPVIVAYPNTHDETERAIHTVLACRAYAAAPEAVLKALARCIDRDNAEHGAVFGLDLYENCCDDRLARALLARATESDTKPGTFRELLWAALSHGLPEAAAYARSLLRLPVPTGQDERDRVVIAATLLLGHAPDEVWEQVRNMIEADEDFGHALVAALASSRYGPVVHGLAEDQLAALYVWISSRYTHAEDPDDEAEAVWVGSRGEVARFQDALLNRLKDRGTFKAGQAVQWIMDQLPHLHWLKYVLHGARESARSKTWTPPSPAQVLKLGGSRDARLVRSGGELLDAVVASLRRLEAKLQGETPAAIDLWNGPDSSSRYRPKDENALSNYVKRHLDEDLNCQGVVVNREVEIRRGEGCGTGENTDIHVDAFVGAERGETADVVTVIVEAKGCWHRNVDTAMETQLVERYLKDNPCRHALYLVGWYNCPQWDPDDDRRARARKRSREEAQREFDAQAERLSGADLEVRAFVLNAALR